MLVGGEHAVGCHERWLSRRCSTRRSRHHSVAACCHEASEPAMVLCTSRTLDGEPQQAWTLMLEPLRQQACTPLLARYGDEHAVSTMSDAAQQLASEPGTAL